MNNLKEGRCIPCEVGTTPLSFDEALQLKKDIKDAWKLEEGKLSRRFTFKGFTEALIFVNKIAKIAETEGHHPNIKISFNKVDIELFTHAIKGLSVNDFIIAAKIDSTQKD